MKILLVRSKQKVFTDLFSFLNSEECRVIQLSQEKSISTLKRNEFDCIIIYINTLTEEECQIIDYLNNENRMDGLIIVSDNSSSDFVVKCLNIGADDCVPASIEIPVLYAKIRSIIRRKVYNTNRKLSISNLVVDLHLRKVSVLDITINFTNMEYKIFLYLITNKDKFIQRENLVESIWGNRSSLNNSYDFLFTHIKNIKNKLKLVNAKITIKNNYGVGYQIEELEKNYN